MKAQQASPTFTHVYAALVAVINTKMPEVGELLLMRVMMQFRRAYARNDKLHCLACTKFLAHLVNQQVAHELVALQLVTLLLDKPTEDSVEVAIGFVKDVGALLTEVSPRGVHGIFERFRSILHEGTIDKRVQYSVSIALRRIL
jgi:pre-mRNA-splicing factor CWC22